MYIYSLVKKGKIMVTSQFAVHLGEDLQMSVYTLDHIPDAQYGVWFTIPYKLLLKKSLFQAIVILKSPWLTFICG
jgi:hypothetical protein